MADFDLFWQSYPRKVGKLIAEEKYRIARRRASAEDILAGVERYKAHKREDIDWCHPKTFLTQGRWMDEYDEPAPVVATVDWYEECQRLHGGTCGGQLRHHNQKAIDDMKARKDAS